MALPPPAGYAEDEDDEGGITPEAQADGHLYVMGGMGSYCRRCTEQHGIVMLDCYYDTSA